MYAYIACDSKSMLAYIKKIKRKLILAMILARDTSTCMIISNQWAHEEIIGKGGPIRLYGLKAIGFYFICFKEKNTKWYFITQYFLYNY